VTGWPLVAAIVVGGTAIAVLVMADVAREDGERVMGWAPVVILVLMLAGLAALRYWAGD